LKDNLSFLGEEMMNCRKTSWLIAEVVCLFVLALALPDMAWSQAPGDANNDGVISRADISAIVDHILGKTPAPGNPDCNRDAAVDIRDVVCLINIVSSQPPPDPGDVAPPVDPTVATALGTATEFLYTGPNPIQTGVAPGTIEAKRAAVLRGKVLDRDGNPFPGATISVLNHPEYGQTLSRTDGMFDLAVNGGGPLTINYARSGYLQAQRQVNVPWQDYIWAPDVVLIQLDPQVTPINLTAPVPIQVARGSVVTDTDGTRQATLLVTQGTSAQMVMPDGSTQPLTSLSIRATEYTVGSNGRKAMPAVLPPTSAYTYCVEVSADEALAGGAVSVNLNQPIYTYVDDFIGFPVGGAVPSGYYNRQTGQWVASENGRVIRILSITGGMVDVDSDGDGSADAALGMTDAERQQLAALYPQAPKQLWRVPITHFTPWDFNWPYGPPDDAVPPEGERPNCGETEDQFCEQSGSIIECQNQILGERIPVVGTPFTMNYRSDRVPGRLAARTVTVPLTGSSIPASLSGVLLEIEVAGRKFSYTFAPATNLRYDFTWDGNDAYGRPVQGRQQATVRVGYQYQMIYYAVPSDLDDAFGRMNPSAEVVYSREDSNMVTWKTWNVAIGPYDFRGQGLGGWSLSAHHFYDPVGQVLFLGDGGRRSAQGNRIITTVAGDGQTYGPVEGVPATRSPVVRPTAVTAGPDGSFYICVHSFEQVSRVLRVDSNGIIRTVVGRWPGFDGDGGPASSSYALLNQPRDVASAPDGSLYIADYGNSRIRRIDPNGIINTVAGNGAFSYGGDGGPATSAQLNYPAGIALGPDGSLYISDRGNHRIRRVDPNGTITTVVGDGNWCDRSCGDGGPVTSAQLAYPEGIAVGPDGNLYIAEWGSNRVRRVTPNGIVSTVAGNGTAGYSGDGGLATEAMLYGPHSVKVGPDGSLYIADENHVIRYVGPDGVITTIAGDGSYGFGGDGGPATSAQLYSSSGVSVGPDGSVYIADYYNNRIRKVTSPMPGLSTEGIPIPSTDGTQLYVFNGAGRHLRTLNTLAGSVIFQFNYDSSGRLIQIMDGNSNPTTIERDGSGNPTAIVGPCNHRTSLSLDSNGYLSGISPAGEPYQFAYTPEGLLTWAQNPGSQPSVYGYDARGRLERADPPGSPYQNLYRTELSNGYDVHHETIMSRNTTYRVENLSTGDKRMTNIFPDATQTTTLFKTDGSGTFTMPGGPVTTARLAPDPRFGMQSPLTASFSLQLPSGLTLTAGQTRTVNLSNPAEPLSLTSMTTSFTLAGRTSTDTYTAASRTLVSTSPAGRTRTITLDNLGRPISLSIPGFNMGTISYDTRGRLSGITSGSGGEIRSLLLTYGTDGFPETVTIPLDRTARYTRDAAGRVTRKTFPNGNFVDFGFNPAGNIVSLTPPGRPAYTFGYDAQGYLTTITPPTVPGTGSTMFSYNADGDPSTITRPGGETITFGYDTGGRPIALTLAANGVPTATYAISYDAAGLIAAVSGPGSQNLSYTYDGFLITGVTWSGPVAGSVNRTYDTTLRVSSETVNGGSAVAFTYDPDSLLIGAGDLSISRNAGNGLLTSTALGIVTDTWTYNGFGDVTSYSALAGASNLYAASYQRDASGRVVRKVETIEGTTSTFDYTYDLRGQLTQVTRDGEVIEAYGYDPNGNRTSATVGGSSINPTYDDQDRLVTYGTNSYLYSPSGKLQRKTAVGGTTEYLYDVLGNLLSVTLPGGDTIAYLLDGADRRISRQVNSTPAERLLYAGWQPVAQLDAAGALLSRFVYAGGTVPAYIVRGGARFKIITDQLGSVRLVVNVETGAVVQRLDYDTFGNVVLYTNEGFQPFGFAGGIYDPDTGLVRFGYRDYDPETGRWTAKDPAGFGGLDTNLYGYVYNDPVNLTDPVGLGALEIIGGVAAAAWDIMMLPVTMIQDVTNLIVDGIEYATGITLGDMELNPVVISMGYSQPGLEPLVDTKSFEFELTRSCAAFVGGTFLTVGGTAKAALGARKAAKLAADAAETAARQARIAARQAETMGKQYLGEKRAEVAAARGKQAADYAAERNAAQAAQENKVSDVTGWKTGGGGPVGGSGGGIW
jgi:RHS repeat-associated protein